MRRPSGARFFPGRVRRALRISQVCNDSVNNKIRELQFGKMGDKIFLLCIK